ncbi:MAG: iron-sulfur cluster assembly scaffold protein [Candidatus Pacearchaeota archaeon]
MAEYNKKVMKYFLHPKNVGEIKNADGVGKVGNIICGDIMRIFIKVDKNKKNEYYIKDIKFKTLGCAAAIATSSVVTELAKGKTFEKALRITNQSIVKFLGGLPPVKYHCSLLAEDALAEAIYNYLKKHKKKIPKELEKKHRRTLLTKKEFQEKFRKV